MKDLSVNLSLLKDDFGDLTVLAWTALDQVDHVVDSTVFQAILLLLIAAIHDRSRQIVGCFTLNDEVENVVCILLGSSSFLLGSFGLRGVRFLIRLVLRCMVNA